MNAECLNKILRIVFAVAAAANIDVERVPVILKEVSKRQLRLSAIIRVATSEDNRPVRRPEASSPSTLRGDTPHVFDCKMREI